MIAGNALVELEQSEALILFDVLARWTNQKDFWSSADVEFVHSAERIAFNNLFCVLETKLVGPLKDDYDHLVEAAQNRLIEQFGRMD